MRKLVRHVIRQIVNDQHRVVADIEHTIGDGACLFRAVVRARQYDISADDEEREALELRYLVCDYLEENADHMEWITDMMKIEFEDLPPDIKEELPVLQAFYNASIEDRIEDSLSLKQAAIAEYVEYMRNPTSYGQHLEIAIMEKILGRGIAHINSALRIKQESAYDATAESHPLPALVIEFNGVNHYSALRFRSGFSVEDIPNRDIKIHPLKSKTKSKDKPKLSSDSVGAQAELELALLESKVQSEQKEQKSLRVGESTKKGHFLIVRKDEQDKPKKKAVHGVVSPNIESTGSRWLTVFVVVFLPIILVVMGLECIVSSLFGSKKKPAKKSEHVRGDEQLPAAVVHSVAAASSLEVKLSELSPSKTEPLPQQSQASDEGKSFRPAP